MDLGGGKKLDTIFEKFHLFILFCIHVYTGNYMIYLLLQSDISPYLTQLERNKINHSCYSQLFFLRKSPTGGKQLITYCDMVYIYISYYASFKYQLLELSHVMDIKIILMYKEGYFKRKIRWIRLISSFSIYWNLLLWQSSISLLIFDKQLFFGPSISQVIHSYSTE